MVWTPLRVAPRLAFRLYIDNAARSQDIEAREADITNDGGKPGPHLHQRRRRTREARSDGSNMLAKQRLIDERPCHDLPATVTGSYSIRAALRSVAR